MNEQNEQQYYAAMPGTPGNVFAGVLSSCASPRLILVRSRTSTFAFASPLLESGLIGSASESAIDDTSDADESRVLAVSNRGSAVLAVVGKFDEVVDEMLARDEKNPPSLRLIDAVSAVDGAGDVTDAGGGGAGTAAGAGAAAAVALVFQSLKPHP